MKRAIDILLPLAVAALLLGAWQWAVAHYAVPAYVLPAPSAIARAFNENFASLMTALANTLVITLEGFAGALIAAVALAILFSQSRLAFSSSGPSDRMNCIH